jgi:acetate kinase
MARATETPFTVLALNRGAATLKFGVYAATGTRVDALREGQAESVADVAAQLAATKLPRLDAVGHRIVHGGPQLREHQRVDGGLLQQLTQATPYAPQALPAALQALQEAQAAWPRQPHVACLDTAFHATLPEAARALPLPAALRAQGVERLGGHGLSCASIVQQLVPGLPARVIVAHLGHSASVTALKDGKSVDNSMSLTPGGGLVSATHGGDIDPGVLFHLQRSQRLDAVALQALVDTQSGLLGISGLSGDMRTLQAAAAAEPPHAGAQLAITLFCQSVAKQVAAMWTVLGGLDLLVFTGGIGENDAAVRAAVCHGLRGFNLNIDDARNRRSAALAIHGATSRVAVQVRPSQEGAQMAREARLLLVPQPA